MKIEQPILAILSECTTSGPNLTLPPRQLDRKDYTRINAVIEACGGKWNRGQKCHMFPTGTTAADAVETAIPTGEVTTAKDLGFFATRGSALSMVMERADVRSGQRVLEPSCGEGDIAERCSDIGASVTAYEIDVGRANKTIPRIGGQGPAMSAVFIADFLSVQPDPIYDRVVMNPPFSVSSDRRADLAHVKHAIGFLKPGGRLVAVMSAGITFREDAKSVSFRLLVENNGGAFHPMPEGSFSVSGTEVRTVILVLEKAA